MAGGDAASRSAPVVDAVAVFRVLAALFEHARARVGRREPAETGSRATAAVVTGSFAALAGVGGTRGNARADGIKAQQAEGGAGAPVSAARAVRVQPAGDEPVVAQTIAIGIQTAAAQRA